MFDEFTYSIYIEGWDISKKEIITAKEKALSELLPLGYESDHITWSITEIFRVLDNSIEEVPVTEIKAEYNKYALDEIYQ